MTLKPGVFISFIFFSSMQARYLFFTEEDRVKRDSAEKNLFFFLPSFLFDAFSEPFLPTPQALNCIVHYNF